MNQTPKQKLARETNWRKAQIKSSFAQIYNISKLLGLSVIGGGQMERQLLEANQNHFIIERAKLE